MGKNSEIEWTHHTFNPWWGCSKVSPACANCYAESWAKRTGHSLWGKDVERRFFSDSHCSEPLRWNEEAGKTGEKKRVFCASMSDVFEDKTGLAAQRKRLWALIENTPNLNWLLLTKRPQNIEKMAPWAKSQEWPENIWLGTTVENQMWADKRLPHLLKHNSAVRFLSCEPLLGELDLSKWSGKAGLNSISWVIAGGESGPNSRPMNPDWLTKLRDYCAKKSIAFHFKQWGHWLPAEMTSENSTKTKRTFEMERPIDFFAMGKTASGRLLDGRTYDELPLIKGVA